jgi:anti-anti-sigma regulatory factor/HAMP domain-containing protein
MSPIRSPKVRRQSRSISNQLRAGFVLVGVISLLVTAAILIAISFQQHLGQLRVIQQERSRAAASEINAYLDDLQRKLGYFARVRGLTDLEPDLQNRLLEGLVRHNSAYQTVAILDHTGQVLSSVSLYSQATLGDLSQSPLFLRAYTQEADFTGPVEIDLQTNLPMTTLAVPIRDQQDNIAGVLLAQIDLKFLWFIVSQSIVGETGYAYVIDNRNVVIAKKGDTPETFRLEDISARPFLQPLLTSTRDTLMPYPGLYGTEVLGASAPIRSVNWKLIVELPTREAYAPLRTMLIVIGVMLGAAVAGTAGIGFLFAKRIIAPLQHLTGATASISAAMTSDGMASGGLIARVDVARLDELGILAQSFNQMATAIEQRTQELQTQYAVANTARLEAEAARAEIATQLTTIEEQREVIRATSVPVLPITRTTLVMPLIGNLNSTRIHLVQEQALRALEQMSARYLLLDITGIPVIDAEVAAGLIRVVQAARLLGAEVILVGIRPEVAQTLVELGIQLTDVRTERDLQNGIAYTLRRPAGMPRARSFV